jgi:5-methyltetrahydrofolate--homocysteine methyltransferase
MDALQDEGRRETFIAKTLDDARKDVFLRTNVGKDIRSGDEAGKRSDVRADVPVPPAPFFGARVLRDIPLDEVFELLDLDELYRLQWGGRGSGPKYEATVRDVFEPALVRLKRDAVERGWLTPKYASDGGSLREIARFHFPRQEGRERLCLADYFRPVDAGTVDVVAFQIVTVGDAATKLFDELQAAGEYAEAFYIHGLAVESAEAVAQWMHRRVRQELGLAAESGKRYSWGYGACPDLDDHATLFRILPADAVGLDLTSAFQLMPEQSTAAIVVHHPEAKYYAVRGEGPDRAGTADAEAQPVSAAS